MVGICLNRLATNMDTRAFYKAMRSSRQTHKQSPELGHADCAWKVGGAEGELELDLVAIVLQRAPGLEFACHHLEKCFFLILAFTSYIFFLIIYNSCFFYRPSSPFSYPYVPSQSPIVVVESHFISTKFNLAQHHFNMAQQCSRSTITQSHSNNHSISRQQSQNPNHHNPHNGNFHLTSVSLGLTDAASMNPKKGLLLTCLDNSILKVYKE